MDPKHLAEELREDQPTTGISWPRYLCDEEYRDHVIASAPLHGYAIDPIGLCSVVGCNEIPTHNFSGERASFCESHTIPGMVNVVTTDFLFIHLRNMVY